MSQTLAAALFGATCGLLLMSFAPMQQTQSWATTGVASKALHGVSAPKLHTPMLPSQIKQEGPYQLSSSTSAAPSNHSAQEMAPFVFAASGFLFLAAAAVRLFRSAPPAIDHTFLALSADSAKFREERENREKEKELQKQREVEERMRRLANLASPSAVSDATRSPTSAAAPTPSVSTAASQPAPAAAPSDEASSAVYLDPAFQKATISAFPAKANATVEEARVLWKLDGYSILDVRSDLEGADGRIRGPNKGSIDIPLFNARATYDSTLGKKVVTQEANAKFLEQVNARFPDKSAKIIVMCSDGTKRSSQTLDLLAAEGYTNVVLMRGGYNRWDQVFDRRLALRTPQQQAAKAEWLDDPVEWGTWASGVGKAAPPPRTVAAVAAPAERTVRETIAVGVYMDPAFQQATIAAFPAKANATIEEARVLWKLDGYSIVDIRSPMEGSEGRIRGPNKGSIDIPLFLAKSTYDPTLGRKVVTQEAYGKWLEQMKDRFPDKASKIIIMCSDGTKRSSEALDLLAAEGYTNVVLMRGGYNRWDQVFDRRLALRSPQQQAAKAEWLDDPVVWSSWAANTGKASPPPRPVAQTAAPAERTVRETVPLGKFDDAGFKSATVAAFQAHKATATVEEARVLWKGEYSILDIRSDFEGQIGRIRGPNKGSVDIPMFQAKATYDPILGKKVITQQRNSKWLELVKARFPKDAKVIIMCSDGTIRSSQAAKLLEAEGFQNLVVMTGGFRKWDQMFDHRLGVRTPAQQQSKASALADPVHWSQW